VIRKVWSRTTIYLTENFGDAVELAQNLMWISKRKLYYIYGNLFLKNKESCFKLELEGEEFQIFREADIIAKLL
jgi:hypothetical protein